MNQSPETPRPMGIANELWALSFDHWPSIDEQDAVADAGLSLAGWDEDCGDVSVIARFFGDSYTSALVAA